MTTESNRAGQSAMAGLGGSAFGAFSFGELFHIGIRVGDISIAMREMTDATGVEWARPQHMEQVFWIPGEGRRRLELDITNSVAGPVHVELLHGSPGTVWDAARGAGVHHLGVWVDDVATTNDDLVRDGWVVELAGDAPEAGYGGFTYVRSPSGLVVETVSTLARRRFERWWAGGDL